MADLQKFLDQSGVSVLWNQVVTKISDQIDANKYDDTQVKADITANAKAISDEVARAKAAEELNAADIAALELLVGEETVANQIATKIAEVVADAPESLDTLKEIAAWISTHADSASAMNTSISNNATAITALQNLVGSKAVATQISEAIEAAGHAKASDLADAVSRIATLEAWKTSHATEYTNLKSDVDNLKGQLDDIATVGGQPNVIETVKVNGVAKTVTEKAVDIVTSDFVAALTEAEIKSAIGVE